MTTRGARRKGVQRSPESADKVEGSARGREERPERSQGLRGSRGSQQGRELGRREGKGAGAGVIGLHAHGPGLAFERRGPGLRAGGAGGRGLVYIIAVIGA